ncbi:hypothetical protein RB595_004183 [Gaeumannomyces hyphopodioides]
MQNPLILVIALLGLTGAGVLADKPCDSQGLETGSPYCKAGGTCCAKVGGCGTYSRGSCPVSAPSHAFLFESGRVMQVWSFQFADVNAFPCTCRMALSAGASKIRPLGQYPSMAIFKGHPRKGPNSLSIYG